MSSSRSSDASSDSARSRTIAGAMIPPAPRIATFIGSASFDEFPCSQRKPELDPVTGVREVSPCQVLHSPDPVPERVPMAIELARGALPLSVALDEGLHR